MKYRTLAVLAFAGVLAVSGTAFAKENDPNDPFKRDPFAEMQRIREKHQEQEQDKWPTFKPGTKPTWPHHQDENFKRPSDSTEDRRPHRRPPENQNGIKPDRRPPKDHKDVRPDRRPPKDHKDVHPDRRPPEPPKDVHSGKRPPEPPKDGHRRKLPPEYRR